MKKYLLMSISALLLCCLYLSPVKSLDPCVPTVENKCTGCHGVATICSKVKKNKSKGTWKKTILRMVNEGAEIDNKEQKMLATCLSSPPDSVKNLCTML